MERRTGVRKGPKRPEKGDAKTWRSLRRCDGEALIELLAAQSVVSGRFRTDDVSNCAT